MDKFQDQPSKFKFYLYSMLSIVLILSISFFILTFEQVRYQKTVENRQLLISLAEELRQSSNDLARLVRTYVITGNPVYKEQFQAVVEIRDGIRARPHNYSLAYWDIKAIQSQDEQFATIEAGEKVALIELMQRAGLTDIELNNLYSSKKKSDILVSIENQAIALVEQDQPTANDKRNLALSMLADDYFISMKAKIMQPIIQTEQMIIERTQHAVNVANTRLKIITFVIFLLGSLLVLLIFKLAEQLKAIIGCSIPELQKVIHELGRGDFLTPIKLTATNNDSVIGWIAKTQRKLAELNLTHFKAIIESSDDAIISKNIAGTIASWNNGAEKIFGYTAAEMIGKKMTAIIPEQRSAEEPEILAKIARGEMVEHFETQRLHKQGYLVDVSVTLSPIYSPKGKVIGASKIARDISKAKAAEAEIHRLAFYDSLTGLANRRLLNDRLSYILAKAIRDKSSFAVIFLDLDNFKLLNDTHGHDAGDDLLKQAAQGLAGMVRASDTVARFGGDEFVMIIDGPIQIDSCNKSWVKTVVDKIIIELGKPYLINDSTHIYTTSIGVMLYNGQNVTVNDLLKQADYAMYEAKAEGKNCYKLYQ